MRKMKNSGIEWIGEIPVGWRCLRLKQILIQCKNAMRVGPFGSALKGDDFVDDGYPVYNQRTVLTDDFYLNNAFIDDAKFNELKNFQVHPYDILITTRGSIGKISIAPPNVGLGIIHPCIIKFSICIENCNNYFLKRIFNDTHVALEQLLIHSNSTTIPVIYSDTLKNIFVPIPSHTEQQRIADFLDSKCPGIDRIIEKQRTVIEKLKSYKQSVITEAVTKGLNPDVPMKDSGIEWIGEIPMRWEVRKLKSLTSIISKGTTPSTVGREIIESGEIRFIKAENIKNNTLSGNPYFSIDIETNKILSRSTLHAGDILFVIAGATIGKTAIINSEFIPANTNQAISFLRIQKNVDVKYIWYCLQSHHITEIIKNVSVQSAQPNLSMTHLGNFFLAWPSTNEASKIANYLDQKCAEIEKLITAKESIIKKLTSYKQSLIYEAVTGKMEI